MSKAKQDLDALEFAKKNKHMLFLHLNTSSKCSGQELLDNEVMCQTLKLISIRVYFNTQGKANSPANQKMFLKLSGFGQGVITSNLPFTGFPIFHASEAQDSTYMYDVKVSLTKKIPRSVKWELVDENGTIIAGNMLDFVQCLFELDIIST